MLCTLLIGTPANAQNGRDIANRLSRLENEIQTLSRAIYKGETPPPGSLSGGDASLQAGAEVRLQQLESELRELRGQLEQQSFEIRQIKEQLDRALGDMELRLNDIEGKGASVAPAQPRYTASPSTETYSGNTQYQDTPPASDDFQWSSGDRGTPANTTGQLGTLSTPATGGAPVGGDAAAAQYESAFSLLKNNQHDAAEKEFQAFIDANPDHVLVGNAKYWLGETFYVRGQFEKAARLFAEGYQKNPRGPKAADNLLKLGMSLAGMGNKTDACVALLQLQKDFPSGSAPVLRRAQQEMTRLGCS